MLKHCEENRTESKPENFYSLWKLLSRQDPINKFTYYRVKAQALKDAFMHLENSRKVSL